MAGHGDALSDDDGTTNLDDVDVDAIEEARTGLDLLLRSLGRHIQPPPPTTIAPVPTVAQKPEHCSSPNSIRADPPAPAGVSDTVLVDTSSSKSTAPRKIKLKQQRLSFARASSSAAVEGAAVNESTARPTLNINVRNLINALDLVSLHALIKCTTSHIESRYVECGDDFGGGLSRWLSPFLGRHGPGKNRNMTVEGVDIDG
ncbi:unnamed protein product [Closterium sp. NIES-54]